MDHQGVPSYPEVSHLFGSEREAERFLIDNGCLNVPAVCGQCNQPVTYRPNHKRVVRCGRKACMLNHGGHRWSQSILEGTFFMGCRLPLNEVLHFLWLFVIGTNNKAVTSHFNWSTKTTTDWMRFAQQLVGEMVLYTDNAIGGPGVIVEIDESKFGKRKYNTGHHVEGVWVFGGVEQTVARRCFLVKVPDRTRATLFHYIRNLILPGTIIRSDGWSSYLTVNHSETFIDPVTGVHTNGIEGTWNGVKQLVPARKRTWDGIQPCLLEFMWRRQNDGRLWAALLEALAEVRYERVWVCWVGRTCKIVLCWICVEVEVTKKHKSESS